MKISLPEELQSKYEDLQKYIVNLGSLAVGFSGGVDSTLLIYLAHELLGQKALAVTAVDSSIPKRELAEAEAFCKEHGIKHVTLEVNPLSQEAYRNNSPDRCYYCKKNIFSGIKELAKEHGIEYVAEGSNLDDLGDYRPGLKAVDELGVLSPLRQAHLYKEDIRAISKALGLPTHDKPSYACLASRFVYGEPITDKKLHMVEAAEEFLIDRGFARERVRIHGNIARIEVAEEDIKRLASDENRKLVYNRLKEIGFDYVTLDLMGYRTGSMNETLNK